MLKHHKKNKTDDKYGNNSDSPNQKLITASPTRLFTVTIVSVFFAEALIMIFLSYLPDLSTLETIILDSTLIVLFVLPCLYFLMYRPLLSQIDERLKAEKSFITSEKKFREYIYNSPNAILVFDSTYHILDINPEVLKLTGFSQQEIFSKRINTLFTVSKSKKHFDIFSELLNTGSASTEMMLITKCGKNIYITFDAVELSKQQYLAFCSDITEIKKLQTQKFRAEKLETAGKIAGQIAHDFNNLLVPLLSYPEFIRETLPAEHEAHNYLKHIENSAKSISNINQQLLTLGLRGHYNQDIINLNKLVTNIADEYQLSYQNINFEINLEENLNKIMGGESQLQRVFSNLVQNAHDSISNNGTISIKTENFFLTEQGNLAPNIPNGSYVKITISDTGKGIPEDIISNIFEPFFTSKKTDKIRGSGLGLSIVDSVINDHNGFVDLKSEINKGTSFYIYFPIALDNTNKNPILNTIQGNEKILIVDDDEIIREVSHHILVSLGYSVTVAESGEKALEIIANHPQDLIMLDMIMPPGIDGTETFKRCLKINPNQKVIFVSGYAETEKVLEAQKLGAGEFVKKPFTKKIISHAIRMELSKNRTPQLSPEVVL